VQLHHVLVQEYVFKGNKIPILKDKFPLENCYLWYSSVCSYYK